MGFLQTPEISWRDAGELTSEFGTLEHGTWNCYMSRGKCLSNGFPDIRLQHFLCIMNGGDGLHDEISMLGKNV